MPPLWPSVFDNVLLRYKVNSSPHRNLDSSAESTSRYVMWQGKHGLMRQVCIRAPMRAKWRSWHKNPIRISPNSKLAFRSHPSVKEVKVPRNIIHKNQHTALGSCLFWERNSGRISRHCKEQDCGAKRSFFMLLILFCWERGTYEFCPIGNRNIKGTSSQVCHCQNLIWYSQQPTKSDLFVHQLSFTNFLTW